MEPDLPPLEDCVPNTEAPLEFLPQRPRCWSASTCAPTPPASAGPSGDPPGGGCCRAGSGCGTDADLDPLALLFAVDALPPVTFDLGIPGWAPTLELSVHVRARPAPGWAKVRHATHNVAGGYFEEDCEVWDSTGRLVAPVAPAGDDAPAPAPGRRRPRT